uniref:Polysaccharide biosynthesis protein C-terminal domain-containing protein n=1 Tax=Aegilops tauschii subsp. strangulata TaxID=200361 RepID=A0A453QEE5_AEGTS
SGSLYPGTVSIELILLALPAVLGQAIDPMAQLMETAYIGKLGALELASAGIGVAIFNILSKIFNIPLLRIATSFVAEDISKNASKHYTSGKLEMPSVSSALVLAAAIGTIEALALFLGSGLFLKLMGVSPVSPMYASARLFLSLRALGAPANVIMLAVQGIFRGFKDTKTPVLFIGLGNLSAVVLLPLLIYGFKLGITGAAISTIASQLLKKFFRYVSVGLQSMDVQWAIIDLFVLVTPILFRDCIRSLLALMHILILQSLFS